MNYRCFVLAALGCLAIHPLAAQNACATQIVPIRPIGMLACPNATPICMTDPNGYDAHWAWMCSPEKSSGARLLDPSIILGGQTPPKIDFVDMMQGIERLRQLRLQNQQIEQQNRQMEQQPRPAQQSTAAPTIRKSELDLAAVAKAFYSCGILDGMLKAMIAVGNVEAADGVRQALKQTSCEEIRKYADVGSTAASVPEW